MEASVFGADGEDGRCSLGVCAVGDSFGRFVGGGLIGRFIVVEE